METRILEKVIKGSKYSWKITVDNTKITLHWGYVGKETGTSSYTVVEKNKGKKNFIPADKQATIEFNKAIHKRIRNGFLEIPADSETKIEAMQYPKLGKLAYPLFISRYYPEHKIVDINYNSTLKELLKPLGLTQIEIAEEGLKVIILDAVVDGLNATERVKNYLIPLMNTIANKKIKNVSVNPMFSINEESDLISRDERVFIKPWSSVYTIGSSEKNVGKITLDFYATAIKKFKKGKISYTSLLRFLTQNLDDYYFKTYIQTVKDMKSAIELIKLRKEQLK